MATKLNDFFEGCNDSCNFSTSEVNEIASKSENNSTAENPNVPDLAQSVFGSGEKKQTMSSFEIAELIGKQHSHVMRDIRALLEQGVYKSNFGLKLRISDLGFGRKREDPYYELTKKGCLILASGYNALLREKIINRWEELEIKNREKLPGTYIEALEALLASEKEKERLRLETEAQKKTIEEQAPKVGYYDDLVERGNNTNIRDTAKELKLGQNEFVRLMITWGILYRDARKKLKPTAEAMERGLCVLKEFTNQTNGHTGNQTMFTVDGKNYIRRRMISKR